ncbi:MAG: 2-oxoacid:ferredoxin oxidoreductase subunit beta [Labilithrix sp.]|nr:2-oxoacid:ferredoxin oxidoreductase subunit beta [Labilithrix sp.]
MSDDTHTAPAPKKKALAQNRLNLELKVYKGADSTLCNGCGHDSITGAIIKALFERDVPPHMVAKLSGIGCSSKTTAYFLGRSHGFNSVHGRMAAIAAGVHAANRRLVNVGVSGDGDTASIGLGNFLHMMRRNVPIVYIVENNGCYGLTKGQFSATADKGSANKGGTVNPTDPIDICALAIEMGCTYVARSFSGDQKQLVPLLKGALAHRGAAVLDVVSPCVTFNNHEGSTKSYPYAKEKEDPLHEIGFVPYYEEIAVDYDPGTTTQVALHDGSRITLKKLGHEHDPRERSGAMRLLERAVKEQLFLTGLIYHDKGIAPLDEQLRLVDEPLATLPASRIRPPDSVLAEVMSRLA